MPEDDDHGAIDAVVTWVDGDDPAHRAKLDRHLGTLARSTEAAAPTRFRAVGEIDYCVASLLKFAPFLRQIHVVTDAQTPAFLRGAASRRSSALKKVRVVDHRAVFAGHEDLLPTFNSLAIETMLHCVPGLARRFVYLNDDFILIKPVTPQVWFSDEGGLVLRGRWRTDPQRRIDRRLRALWMRWRGGDQAMRAGHVRSQALAARMAGFRGTLFELTHEPHPMDREQLEAYYAARPSALRDNASYRLRDARQFVPQSLAAHLALRDGLAHTAPDDRLLYLKPATLTASQTRQALERADSDSRVVFACIQSLDQAPREVHDIVAAWLDRIVGRVAAGGSEGYSRHCDSIQGTGNT